MKHSVKSRKILFPVVSEQKMEAILLSGYFDIGYSKGTDVDNSIDTSGYPAIGV